MDINSYFDNVYVINMTKSLHKRLKVLHHLDSKNIRVNLFPAIDGSLEKRVPSDMRAGEYGYFLTWYKIVKQALIRNYSRILCLDDDVIAHRDINALWLKQQTLFPADWAFIYLGASQHAQIIDWTQAQKQGGYQPKNTDGSFAMAVSHIGLKLLWTAMNNKNEQPLPQVFDSGLLRTLTKHHTSLVCYPNLFIADVSTSDIRHARDQKQISSTFKWDLENYIISQPADTWLNYLNSPMPLISVIVAAYNAQETIWDSLMSILNQTYARLQIIVVNDGSSDHTAQLITAFEQNVRQLAPNPDCSRTMVYIDLQQNHGCYYARNQALQALAPDTQLVAFQDADDVSLSYRLLEQAINLWANGLLWNQCLILRTHLKHIDLNLAPAQLTQDINQVRIHKRPNNPQEYAHCCASVLGMATGLYKASLFKQRRFLELQCGADAEFVLRLLKEEANINIQENAVAYLTRVGSIPGIFYKINKIMYLCCEMTANNLTVRFPIEQRAHWT